MKDQIKQATDDGDYDLIPTLAEKIKAIVEIDRQVVQVRMNPQLGQAKERDRIGGGLGL